MRKPANPRFSSGPCAKRPGWSLAALEGAMLGRSHRAPAAKAKLREVIERSRAVLGMPAGWVCGIVPGSDTGAIEMAMWNLLGPRGVDVLAWESFSLEWAKDARDHLRLPEVRVLQAEYGRLPDLRAADWRRDVVFVWNGTTSGVRLPDAGWIPEDREGLAICDATSAAFAMEMDWSRLDVVTWSWQKALGGEAAHGMLALSPRAQERLKAHRPAWPLPKLFRLGQGVWEGETVNTPSMLCVEDALDGLRWAEGSGGLPALVARSEANLAAIAAWEARSPWASFLAGRPEERSCTSVCLRFRPGAAADEAGVARRMAAWLDREGVALDVANYRDAPPGLRIWCGATVERADVEALLPWLDAAWEACQPG
ncbi:phosphoserine transaminase [Roseococcus sp. DSY-14]|uniref:phosphoserine transaminase n=1 Tax=Roseococcus sp. DSY-14 TaxID=3369650 RepID=UPI00387B0A82